MNVQSVRGEKVEIQKVKVTLAMNFDPCYYPSPDSVDGNVLLLLHGFGVVGIDLG